MHGGVHWHWQVAFQTGYLTIKHSRMEKGGDFTLTLGPPNAEVLTSLTSSFFLRLSFNKHDEYTRLLLSGDFDAACAQLQTALRAMPSGILPKNGIVTKLRPRRAGCSHYDRDAERLPLSASGSSSFDAIAASSFVRHNCNPCVIVFLQRMTSSGMQCTP